MGQREAKRLRDILEVSSSASARRAHGSSGGVRGSPPSGAEGQQDERPKCASRAHPAISIALSGRRSGRTPVRRGSQKPPRRVKGGSAARPGGAEQHPAEHALRGFRGTRRFPSGVDRLRLEAEAGGRGGRGAGSDRGCPLFQPHHDGAASANFEEDLRHLFEKRHEGRPIGRVEQRCHQLAILRPCGRACPRAEDGTSSVPRTRMGHAAGRYKPAHSGNRQKVQRALQSVIVDWLRRGALRRGSRTRSRSERSLLRSTRKSRRIRTAGQRDLVERLRTPVRKPAVSSNTSPRAVRARGPTSARAQDDRSARPGRVLPGPDCVGSLP